MIQGNTIHDCRSCGFSGTGKYCSRCGQPYLVKRITLKGLIHDVFHLFTHLDKGFGYTLKELIVSPGLMQRAYIEGDRARHQKPFSMFFICATVAALTRYWIFLALIKFYNVGSISEANFSHAYMVMLQMGLAPLYALITYLLFYRAPYNYAETGVLVLYTMSFVFIIACATVLLKFIWPDLDTAYIEYPIFLVYNTITLLNFFNTRRWWEIVIKSLIIATAVFFVIQNLEDLIIGRIAGTVPH